eukprot:1155229-Pelagomonas_calceolata.AAC.10
MGIRRVASSSPCPTLAMRVDRGLLKSVSGASKFISVLGRMSMKLQSKRYGLMNVQTKRFRGIQSVRGVDEPTHT